MKLNSNRESIISSEFMDSRRSWDQAIDLIDQNIQKFSMILNDFKAEKYLKNNECNKGQKSNINNNIDVNKIPNKNYRKINNSTLSKNDNYNNKYNKEDCFVNASYNDIGEMKPKINHFYNSEKILHPSIQIINLKKKRNEKQKKINDLEPFINNNSNYKTFINNELIKTKKMDNLLNRLSNKNNFISNNSSKSFTNLTSSKCNLKISNMVFNQSPIKKMPRLDTDIDQIDDVDILNTTNDKIKDEPEEKFNLNKEKSEGSLICKNRTLEPIISLKNENVNESGKYGKLSRYLLNNIKNESNNKSDFSRSPIGNGGKYKEFVNNKNNYNPVNQNFYKSYNCGELNIPQSFNDSRMKYAIEKTGDCTKDRVTANNVSLKFRNDLVDKNNYKSNNLEIKIKNLRENDKLINIHKTALQIPSSNPIKKLNNTKISEDDEDENTYVCKQSNDKPNIYSGNQINYKAKINNNFIQNNNNKYINIVNEINTSNVNFISQAQPNRNESHNEDYKIPIKKESIKIFCDPRILCSKPNNNVGDKSYKTPEIPTPKDKNFKSMSSKNNLIVNQPIKNHQLNSSKNSSMNKKNPLYTNEGLLNFVNKARITVGKDNKENEFENINDNKKNFYMSGKLKSLYESNKSNNEALLDFNSNQKELDKSRNYGEYNENGYQKGNISKPFYSQKINFKENQIKSAFKLADSVSFVKNNYNTNFNNGCKKTDKLGSINNINKDLKKNSIPNSSNIFNYLAKKEEIKTPNNRLSKVTIDLEKIDSTFANDINYIIANQRHKNSQVKKENYNKFISIPESKERKKSSLNNNNETKSNTDSLNSGEIISGNKIVDDKEEDLVLCCASNKIDYLKTNLQNIDEKKNNNNNQKLPNSHLTIKRASMDIISNLDLKAHNLKIIRLQSLFRGVLLRKIFRKCYGNFKSLTKLMSLFDKLSKRKQIENIQKLFKNLNIIREEFIQQIRMKFLNMIIALYDNKLKSFKVYFLRKIYLFSFTKKISNDFEIKQSRELNKSLEKQKSQFLVLQKEKENHKRDLKFSVVLTNFVNTKLFNFKSSFLKKIKEISSELKFLDEKRFFTLKKIISFIEKKNSHRNSSEYLSFYLKGLFVYWKNLAQKTHFLNKMKKFMLEKIINKKNKLKNDEQVILSIIEKKGQGEKIKLDKENLYYSFIKDSFSKILMYFNRIYFSRIDSENKSNKLMFMLQKLIYNKKNVEIRLRKKYLNRFRVVIETLRNELKSKRKLILYNLIQYKFQNFSMVVKSKLEQWLSKAKMMTKKNTMLLNLLIVKFSKNFISTRRYFKTYRFKAKQISSQTKKLNYLFNVVNVINERIKSEIYQQLIKKLRSSVKWNKESQDKKIVTIHCSMTRETLEKNLNLINEDNELLNDSSIQDFLIEKNFRFKIINNLWRLSNNDKLILRYYLLKLFNSTNLILIKEFKKNSFKWSSNTYYKENKRNYSNNQYISKEGPLIDTPIKELKTNESKLHEKSRVCQDLKMNKQSIFEEPLSHSYSRISTIQPIRRQESGINSELIIQKYKNDLIKTLGIESLSSQNVSFDLDKIHEGFKNEKLLLSTQNLENSVYEDRLYSKLDNSNLEDEDHNKKSLLNKNERAFIKIIKLFTFKKHQIFFGLLRSLKLKTLQFSAKLITKNLKFFFEKSKKSSRLKPEDLELNEEIRNDLIKNNNLILKPQENFILTLENISAYKNQKVKESSANNQDDSGYSACVIDLIRVIQLYIYDQANPINKYNYLLRVFNKWRNITNKMKFELNVNTNCTSLQERLESLTDISPIVSESSPTINRIRNANIIQNQDTSNQDTESLIVCMSASRPQKKNNSVGIYANYMNSLSNKIEKFIEKLQRFCLRNFINHIQQKQKTKKLTFLGENEDAIYISDNSQNKNSLKDSIKKMSDSKKKSNLKCHKKQHSTDKNLRKLEIFSFDVNLSASVNYNCDPNTFRNRFNKFAEEMNLNNNSLNFQVNRSISNYNVNKNLRKNTENNKSFSQNPYLNIGNNQSVVYSKNMTFNSELRSDEEPEEINEVRISCAIEIQNFWREHRIQRYLLNYANKLKLLDRFIKKKNLKLKNLVFISYTKWKKNFFMSKINKAVKILQKFYRKKIEK